MSLTFFITGGNDGIGRTTAQVLLERGHRVIIAGRSAEKLKAAADTLRHRTNSEKIDWIICNLADLSSVRQAASTYQQRYDHLDVLINNAGMFTNQPKLSKDGFELQFAVNYLGPFLLTKLLLPSLEASTKGGRIVNLSSVAHYHGQLNLDTIAQPDTRNYRGLDAYSRSKLAIVLFTRELARRFPNISSNCLHPGAIRTNFGNKNANWGYSLIWNLYKPFMRTTRCGARTVIYLSLSPEVNGVSGRYFDHSQCCQKPAALAKDDDLCRELWEMSEVLVEG